MNQEEKIAKRLYEKYSDQNDNPYKFQKLYQYGLENNWNFVGVTYAYESNPAITKEIIWQENPVIVTYDRINGVSKEFSWKEGSTEKKSDLIVIDCPYTPKEWHELNYEEKHFWVEDARELIELL